MISLILGVVTLGLGLKGFSAAGLPLTKQRNLTGPKAKLIGGICITLAVVLLLDGVLWIGRMAGFLSRAAQ